MWFFLKDQDGISSIVLAGDCCSTSTVEGMKLFFLKRHQLHIKALASQQKGNLIPFYPLFSKIIVNPAEKFWHFAENNKGQVLWKIGISKIIHIVRLAIKWHITMSSELACKDSVHLDHYIFLCNVPNFTLCTKSYVNSSFRPSWDISPEKCPMMA